MYKKHTLQMPDVGKYIITPYNPSETNPGPREITPYRQMPERKPFHRFPEIPLVFPGRNPASGADYIRVWF